MMGLVLLTERHAQQVAGVLSCYDRVIVQGTLPVFCYAEGMTAYVRLQEREFSLEADGYTATRHQREVGAGYFDLVAQAVSPESSTLALKGSTEEAQFKSQATA